MSASVLEELVGPPTPKPKPVRAPEPLRPVPAADIHARRHPVAIVLVWFFDFVAAFVIATPVYGWARAVWASHPDGDAPIFRPGGLALVEWLNADGPTLSVVLRASVVLIVLFALASRIVTGALVATLATRGSRPMQVGVAAFLPLLALDVIAGVLQGALLGVGFYLSSGLDHSMQHAFGDERAFVARVVLFSLFAVLVLVLGVVADLGRVAIAREVALAKSTRPLRDGLKGALVGARAELGRACLGWGVRAIPSAALLVLGGAVSDHVGALWVIVIVHQLAIAGRAALRTSWLANALRLVIADSA